MILVPKIESLLLLFHLKLIGVPGAALYNSQDLGFMLQFGTTDLGWLFLRGSNLSTSCCDMCSDLYNLEIFKSEVS